MPVGGGVRVKVILEIRNDGCSQKDDNDDEDVQKGR